MGKNETKNETKDELKKSLEKTIDLAKKLPNPRNEEEEKALDDIISEFKELDEYLDDLI